MTDNHPVVVNGSQRLAQRLGYGNGWLVSTLPLGMQSDEFLVRFLSIFEEVATSLRASADSISRIADANVTTPAMVRYLGQWVGAPALDSRLALKIQRNIVLATGANISSRGTAEALRAVLVAVTDDEVEVIDSGGVFRQGQAPEAGHAVVVRVASLGHLNEPHLIDLVLASVPANVPVTIECAGRRLYPVARAVSA